MKKRYLLILLFIILGFAGFLMFNLSGYMVKSINVVTVKRGALNPEVFINGKIEAEKKADLVFKITGRVSKLLVKKGDRVEKGDILTFIEADEFVKNKEMALKDYMVARWDFEQVRDDYNVGERVDRSTLNDTEKRTVEKKQFLLDKSVKNVEIYAHTLRDTYIYAPFSGTITNVDIEEGNYTSLTKPAISIQNLDSLRVTANISEMDIVSMAVGVRLVFTLDSYPNMRFSGIVSEIDPAETVIEGVVYYKTTIIPDGLPSGARSGMTAEITVEKTQKQALILPLYAFQKIDGNSGRVKIQRGNETITEYITLGEKGENGTIEVVSGLNEGDKIIVDDLPSEK